MKFWLLKLERDSPASCQPILPTPKHEEGTHNHNLLEVRDKLMRVRK